MDPNSIAWNNGTTSEHRDAQTPGHSHTQTPHPTRTHPNTDHQSSHDLTAKVCTLPVTMPDTAADHGPGPSGPPPPHVWEPKASTLATAVAHTCADPNTHRMRLVEQGWWLSGRLGHVLALWRG